MPDEPGVCGGNKPKKKTCKPKTLSSTFAECQFHWHGNMSANNFVLVKFQSIET